MSFEQFLSKVKTGGLARNNRFAVAFYGLPVASLSSGNQLRDVLLLCDAAQLPGQSYATVPNRTFGELRETPYDRLYEPITLSFYVDRGMEVKYFFDRWMDKIYNPGSRKFAYYDEYTCDAAITVLDSNTEPAQGRVFGKAMTTDWEEWNNETYTVSLREMYPKSVSAVSLDNANKDVMKLTVTFQYKYWTSMTHETFNTTLGEPINPNIFESYNSDFYDFQGAFNSFTGASSTGGTPGFDGSVPDAQGFLTSATQKMSDFVNGSKLGAAVGTYGFTKLANGGFPKLSNIMNLEF